MGEISRLMPSKDLYPWKQLGSEDRRLAVMGKVALHASGLGEVKEFAGQWRGEGRKKKEPISTPKGPVGFFRDFDGIAVGNANVAGKDYPHLIVVVPRQLRSSRQIAAELLLGRADSLSTFRRLFFQPGGKPVLIANTLEGHAVAKRVAVALKQRFRFAVQPKVLYRGT